MGTLGEGRKEEKKKRRKEEKEMEEGNTEFGIRNTEEPQSAIGNQQSAMDSSLITHHSSFPAPRTRKRLAAGVLVGLGVLAGLPPLLTWQRTGEQRARSLSNLRRLGEAWQLYAQDWDGKPVLAVERRVAENGAAEQQIRGKQAGQAEPEEGEPEEKSSGTYWLTWVKRLGAYDVTAAILNNPANSTEGRSPSLRDPTRGFVVSTSYALNTRFWNTFAPGPFPVDNLELPAQTALFVEAGPMSAQSLRAPRSNAESHDWARLEYGDTADVVEGLWPYPSTHGGKMAIVAADGHAVSLTVEHYSPTSGPHNALYGRIGGDIYNWNGGHANGDVDHPPVE